MYAYLEDPTLSLYYHYYNQTAGFLNNEFNGGCNPSVIKLNNGNFSFPSMKGLVQFDPRKITPIVPGLKIYVDRILGNDSVLQNADGLLNVPNKIHHLKFFVSSPYFGNPYNQDIQYKISGLDSNWYSIGDDNLIKLDELRSGRYELSLRKKAGFGSGNYIVQNIPFYLHPAFYETWWFRSLLVLIFLALVYLIYRARIGYLLRKKNELENEVQARTKEQELLIESLEHTIHELEDSKEELYQSNLLKEKLAMIIAHDLQSPLRFLFEGTRRMYKKSVEKKSKELTDTSSELLKATGSIYRFVDDFGWWLNSMGKNFAVEHDKTEIIGLLAELESFFFEQLKAKGNRIIFPTYKLMYVISDRQLLKIMLRNIIDNANKNTTSGLIEISLQISADRGIIIIKDDGVGMNDIQLLKIKKRFQEKSMDNREKENGYGYRFVADFSKLLHIHVDIESEIDQGTTVTLSNFKVIDL